MGEVKRLIKQRHDHLRDTSQLEQLDTEQLEAGLAEILRSPADEGTVELIVRRPVVDERELLEEAELDLERGLVGDDWYARGSKSMSDGSSNPDAQLTLANARAVDLVAAGDRERWALAGDQFYVDFDISEANLPGGHSALAGHGGDRGERGCPTTVASSTAPASARTRTGS